MLAKKLMEALIVYLERFPAACIASIPTTVRRRVTQLKLLGSCCAAKVFAIKIGIIDAVNDLRVQKVRLMEGTKTRK